MKLPLPIVIVRGAASLLAGVAGGVIIGVMTTFNGWVWPDDIILATVSGGAVVNLAFDVFEFAAQVIADERALLRARKGFGA